MKTDILNSQQILFINSLFTSQQKEPIFVNVTEKNDGHEYRIECVGGNPIVYRIHFKDGSTTLWDSWSSKEEIENTFRMCSF